MKKARIIALAVIAALVAADILCFAHYAGDFEIRSYWQVVAVVVFHFCGFFAIWKMVDDTITRLGKKKSRRAINSKC